MIEHRYRQTKEKSSYGAPKDSCIYCGRTRAAHQKPPVRVLFQGREHVFKDWDEAQEHGFFPCTDKESEFGNVKNVVLNPKIVKLEE